MSSKRLSPRPARLILPKLHPPRAAALVVHSWWGLTPSFTRFASELAAKGIAVGLSDLFDGHLARTEAAAKDLRSAPRSEPIYRGLQRDVETLRTTANVSKVAVMGFSMGAHWAVWLSQQPGNTIDKVVLYYGARGGNFAASRADYLAHFAETDPWVSTTARHGMEKALSAASRPYAAFDYPGAGHWFAESDRPDAFDPDAAQRAFARTLAHIDGDHIGISAQ